MAQRRRGGLVGQIAITGALAAFLIPTFKGTVPWGGEPSGLRWVTAGDSLTLSMNGAATSAWVELEVITGVATTRAAFSVTRPGLDSVFVAVRGAGRRWQLRLSGEPNLPEAFAWASGVPVHLRASDAGGISLRHWVFHGDQGEDSRGFRIYRTVWGTAFIIMVLLAGVSTVIKARETETPAVSSPPISGAAGLVLPWAAEIAVAALDHVPPEKPEARQAIEAMTLGATLEEARDQAYPNLDEREVMAKTHEIGAAFRKGLWRLLHGPPPGT